MFDPAQTGDLVDAERVRTSALDRIPGAHRYFRFLAPLYPAAFEAFDLRAYDLIVSTTTAWAKGVRFRPDAVHVCYIHTPSRFVFAYDGYVSGFSALGKNGVRAAAARPIVDRLAAWDRRAAARPTAFIANSHNVAARVRRYYERDAFVVHCPIDVDRFAVGTGAGGYLLTVSRLLSYKRVDIAIDAARSLGMRLLIVGTGPARAELEARALGGPIDFLGEVSDRALCSLMGGASAVIVPGEEDYGLVPLEANASGRPVIAFGGGGALETVRAGITGEFFAEATADSLVAALRAFDPGRYDGSTLRAHAENFGAEPFKARLTHLVAEIAAGLRPSRDNAAPRE